MYCLRFIAQCLLGIFLVGALACGNNQFQVAFYYPPDEPDLKAQKIASFQVKIQGAALQRGADGSFDKSKSLRLSELDCRYPEEAKEWDFQVKGLGKQGPEPVAKGRLLFSGDCQNSRQVNIFVSRVNAFSTLGILQDKKTLKAQLQKGRIGHRSTVLKDGRVLVIGGLALAADTPLQALQKLYLGDLPPKSQWVGQVEVYDPVSASLQVFGTLRQPRIFHTVTLLPGGALLVAGGLGLKAGKVVYLKSTELIKPNGKIEAGPELHEARGWHTATLFQKGGSRGVAFVGGFSRFTEDPFAKSMEFLDLQTNKSTPTKADGAEHKRALHTANLLQVSPKGQGAVERLTLVIAGGAGLDVSEPQKPQFQTLDSILKLSVTSGKLQLLSTHERLSEPRAGHTATILQDGRLLLVGGMLSSPDSPLLPLDIYPSIEVLSASGAPGYRLVDYRDEGRYTFNPEVLPRVFHQAVRLDTGEILLSGGLRIVKGALSVANHGTLLTPLKEGFLESAPLLLKYKRFLHTTVSLQNGSILLIGGADAKQSSEKLNDSPRVIESFVGELRTLPGVDKTFERLERCYTGPASTRGVGECQEGLRKEGSKEACTNEVTPQAETCDGKDNDCDGQTDEGCGKCVAGSSQACSMGPGCPQGLQICDANGLWGDCESSGNGKPEACDGVDNNCNGQIDENCGAGDCKSGETRPCYGGTQGCQQNPAGDWNCSGPCKAGEQVCDQGKWGPCKDEVKPSTELCGNGKDDDCNGKIDELCYKLRSNSYVSLHDHFDVGYSGDGRYIPMIAFDKWLKYRSASPPHNTTYIHETKAIGGISASKKPIPLPGHTGHGAVFSEKLYDAQLRKDVVRIRLYTLNRVRWDGPNISERSRPGAVLLDPNSRFVLALLPDSRKLLYMRNFRFQRGRAGSAEISEFRFRHQGRDVRCYPLRLAYWSKKHLVAVTCSSFSLLGASRSSERAYLPWPDHKPRASVEQKIFLLNIQNPKNIQMVARLDLEQLGTNVPVDVAFGEVGGSLYLAATFLGGTKQSGQAPGVALFQLNDLKKIRPFFYKMRSRDAKRFERPVGVRISPDGVMVVSVQRFAVSGEKFTAQGGWVRTYRLDQLGKAGATFQHTLQIDTKSKRGIFYKGYRLPHFLDMTPGGTRVVMVSPATRVRILDTDIMILER